VNFGNPGSAGFLFVVILATAAWFSARSRRKRDRKPDAAEAPSPCSFCGREDAPTVIRSDQATICQSCVAQCTELLARGDAPPPSADADADLPVN
jgi:hypothetical protein